MGRMWTALPVLLALAQPQWGQEPGAMARDYLAGLAMRQLAERKEAVASIGSAADFEKRRALFRKRLLEMIGGLPEASGKLSLRRTGRLERDGYRVEKLVYESQPGMLVTANLYVPETGKAPYPAVLHSTGHSVSAKNRAFYQTLSIGLVKHGFVVLTYDPAGQGERRIFYDPDLQDSKVGGTTTEHEMVGTQSLLAGESIARQMILDGMRGIDVLQSLPEVDGRRIGITGCSGGGTLTTYLAAVDDRAAVAAPACYISSWEDQLQVNTGPQDAEQQFPDLLRNGYDHADFVAAFAPKPYLICSTDEDFFPLSGARKTYQEARRMWGLLGAPERIEWFHEPGGHGMPRATREAIYGWMKRWLADEAPGPAAEPPIRTEYEQALNATPTGQLATSFGGETVSTINLRRYAAWPRVSHPAPGALRRAVLDATRAETERPPVMAERSSRAARGGYSVERLVYRYAAGRFVPAAMAVPGRSSGKAVVWAGGPAASAFNEGGDPDRLAAMGYTVLAIDVFARGETAPDWRSYSEAWFGKTEKVAWLALMVGRPLVGLRIEDISAGVDLLEKEGRGTEGIVGFGTGLGAVEMLHAAFLDPRITALALEDMLVSYRAFATAPIHRQVFDLVLPGVLSRYDLPDLAAAVAPRPVWIVNARSPLGRPLLVEQAREIYRGPHIRVGLRGEPDNVTDSYPELR